MKTFEELLCERDDLIEERRSLNERLMEIADDIWEVDRQLREVTKVTSVN